MRALRRPLKSRCLSSATGHRFDGHVFARTFSNLMGMWAHLVRRGVNGEVGRAPVGRGGGISGRRWGEMVDSGEKWG